MQRLEEAACTFCREPN